MDYTKQSLPFKLKKALRYARLYGLDRTLIKIRGQYHMKKAYDELPREAPQRAGRAHVGLLGCGNYAYSNIAYYLHKQRGPVLRAAMDLDKHRAASLFETYQLAYYTDDASRILDDPAVDLIFIASNHASHAEYAIEALRRGKNVHIEKPHVVSEDQLERLVAAAQRGPGKIVSVGFNRPHSRVGQQIKRYLAAEDGAAMLNWFIAGHEIGPDHWYFKPEEGGRVLGNLCHWTDFVYQMIPAEHRYPLTINPTRSVRSDCDIAVTYVFGDGSIAAITFSAKGHTFEGVRERFAAHRGNVLISMDDFTRLIIEVVDQKYDLSRLHRDHGHQASIVGSYDEGRKGTTARGLPLSYVWETGQLFLQTKNALERSEVLRLGPWDPARTDR